MNAISNSVGERSSTDRKTAWLGRSGIGLRYALHGSGPVSAVMIHELGGSMESWDHVAAGLESTIRLLRYDQRGQGKSDKVGAPYSLDDQVDDLRNLLDEVAISRPVWLIASAAGAAIAASFAIHFPGDVAGIVMCAPALDVDPARRHYLQERAELAMRKGMAAIVDKTLENSWPTLLRGDVAALDKYRSRFVASDPAGYAFASRALSDIDLLGQLHAVACPCLVLAGEHDVQRPPERLARQAARMTRATYDIVPSAGHLMAVQRPVDVAKRIGAFIESTHL